MGLGLISIGYNQWESSHKDISDEINSDWSNVTGIQQVNPLMAAIRLIKNQFGNKKPEIYKAIVAILHDYKASFEYEHRERVIISWSQNNCNMCTYFKYRR